MATTIYEKSAEAPPPPYSQSVPTSKFEEVFSRQTDSTSLPSYELSAPGCFTRTFLTFHIASSQSPSYIARWKGGVTIHAGADKTAPVVAAGRLRNLHPDQMALGDPAHGDETTTGWEELRTESFWRGKYRFTATIDGERREYEWQPTSTGPRMKRGLDFEARLVERASGAAVAQIFVSKGWNYIEGGYFRMEQLAPKELELWTMLSGSMLTYKHLCMTSASLAAAVS